MNKSVEELKKASFRSAFLSLLGFFIVMGSLVYSAYHLRNAELRIAQLKHQEEKINKETVETASNFVEIVMATRDIERLIESKESYLRTIDEARFLIDVRMKFDEINKRIDKISLSYPQISTVKDCRQWVTIVESSQDISGLRTDAARWRSVYGKLKVAIFKCPNGFYALALISDGSFTTAYRLTVSLHENGRAPGAYFARSENWGKNYLSGE